jgi:hypothetical protein
MQLSAPRMPIDFMRRNDTKNGPPCQRVSATSADLQDRSSYLLPNGLDMQRWRLYILHIP